MPISMCQWQDSTQDNMQYAALGVTSAPFPVSASLLRLRARDRVTRNGSQRLPPKRRKRHTKYSH
ncbi:hypothetical protein DM02DRAFT_619589 [Periconia macrospinosa]|uniref:Uncharacterized protein n=1 Tax=Periconia macrospinosa TaxID=97972 RepID=A0A2V1D4L0_9PLEO|nr:hypothetical protein DM02DRAFT_619589 [Periconia macrospinosa]